MSTRVRTDDQRARMNALYCRLRNGSEALFQHDGLIHLGCPRWVVKAYVEARQDGLDVVGAVGAAHFGDEARAVIRDCPASLIGRAARAWAWRLGKLEAIADGARAAA